MARATPFRNSVSSRMSAQAWRPAAPAEVAGAYLIVAALLSCGGRPATGSALRGGSAWRPSRLRFGLGLPLQGREIAKRHKSNEAFIAAHHRQAADPPTSHFFRHFLDALAFETIQHVGGHRLAYGGLSTRQTLCRDLLGTILAANG